MMPAASSAANMSPLTASAIHNARRQAGLFVGPPLSAAQLEHAIGRALVFLERLAICTL
jgi:hypothetical protein